jgi:hypothetical protein
MATPLDELAGVIVGMTLDFDMPSDKVCIGKSNIESAGRGLFATRDIAAGEEVLRSSPLILIVVEGQENRICDWCHTVAGFTHRVDTMSELLPGKQVEDVRTCAACKRVGYCSTVWLLVEVLQHKPYAN